MRLSATLSFIFALLVSPAFAAPKEPPALGKAEQDKELFGNKSAADFFAERMKAPDCGGPLKKAREAHDDARLALDGAVGRKAAREVDDLETTWVTARNTLMKLVAKCECVSKPVTKITAGDLLPKFWYRADASCFIPKEDSYPTVVDSLKERLKYVGIAKGFPALLAYKVWDAKEKELTEPDKLPAFPHLAFLALRGPEGLLDTRLAIGKIFNVSWTDGKDAKSVLLQIDTAATPTGYTQPSMVDQRPLNKKLKVNFLPSGQLDGFWYVEKGTYVRFVLRGEFALPNSFLTDEGAALATDTAWELISRLR